MVSGVEELSGEEKGLRPRKVGSSSSSEISISNVCSRGSVDCSVLLFNAVFIDLFLGGGVYGPRRFGFRERVRLGVVGLRISLSSWFVSSSFVK